MWWSSMWIISSSTPWYIGIGQITMSTSLFRIRGVTIFLSNHVSKSIREPFVVVLQIRPNPLFISHVCVLNRTCLAVMKWCIHSILMRNHVPITFLWTWSLWGVVCSMKTVVFFILSTMVLIMILVIQEVKLNSHFLTDSLFCVFTHQTEQWFLPWDEVIHRQYTDI